MNRIVLGDPGAGTPQFNLLMPDTTGGKVVFFNESPYGLDFTIMNTTFRVPSDHWREITINGAVSQPVTWAIANTQNPSAAPFSEVIVECYGVNECPANNMAPMGRQSNVGNGVPVGTQATNVVNDGSGGTTNVVEATPSGAPSSTLLLRADGSGLLGGGYIAFSNAGIFTSLPAGAIPAAALSGAVPSAATLNGDVTANDDGTHAGLYSQTNGEGIQLGYKDSGGTFHGVIQVNNDGSVTIVGGLPAAQVGSGYPASSVGSGALPSGVTIPGGQVSSAVANATNATNATNASNIPASGVSGGTFPGASNAYRFNGYLDVGGIALTNGGGVSGIRQIYGSGSATVNTGISGIQAVVVNTYNGSNSTTYGSGSYTSSTCYVYQYNAQPWVGIVFIG